MDGRPNPRNKAELSNSLGAVRTRLNPPHQRSLFKYNFHERFVKFSHN